jgi:hypothetical protein
LTFYWTLKPNSAGIYEGNVWFYLVFVESGGTGAAREPMSAQTIKIHAMNFFGIPPKKVHLAVWFAGSWQFGYVRKFGKKEPAFLKNFAKV